MSKNSQTLSAEELAAFSEQLALTVKTGIPLSESIMILAEDADTAAAKALLSKILNALENGKPLADALRDAGVFPEYMTQMIEIGEASGRLDGVLDSLSSYYSRQDNISKSIRSAVTYPAIMLCILVAIILILVIKVLPIFNEVFNSLGGAPMSPLAAGAMALGNAVSTYSVAIILIIAAIAVILIIMRLTPGGRKLQSRASQKIFRKLSSKMASGKFASGMALMTASGLDVNRSVEMVLPLMDNPKMYAKVKELKNLIDDGASFSDSVVKTEVFTGMEARMLVLGFKSGNLDTVMAKIANGYETQVDDRLDSLISVIEPTMVAVLCIIVGLILLSAMLPLLAVMTAIV
ncbi:MAG: type II secretion system F family protein [Clostridiales Family XIII bacterium]|jgi:type IV pilus assembly protein PilC|nr:type II secretion system F family protein [Clostridiales Family XIII bacterium]